LKESLSHSFSNDRDLGELQDLGRLVKRLASQETVDKNWRNLVLDVSSNTEFVARELDGDDIEVEVYRSGAGNRGQRQKLAATCLAAALAINLVVRTGRCRATRPWCLTRLSTRLMLSSQRWR
jgi:uncharacterized protein YPO0396